MAQPKSLRNGPKTARKSSVRKPAPKKTSSKLKPAPGKVLQLENPGPRSRGKVAKIESVRELSVMSIITVRKVRFVPQTGRFTRLGAGENGSGRAARILSDGEVDHSAIEDLIEELLN